jgi:hypothetical protein
MTTKKLLIETLDAKKWQKGLAKGNIPELFRREVAKYGVTLSADATSSVSEEGIVISDKRSKFLLAGARLYRIETLAPRNQQAVRDPLG